MRIIYLYSPKHYIVLHEGDRLYYREPPGFVFDREIRGYMMNHALKKGEVVVDAGACRGLFTVLAAKKVGDDGRVIAFEPVPSNFEKLKANVEMNDLNNVILIKKGLWKESAQVSMTDDARYSTMMKVPTKASSILVEVARAEDELDALGLKRLDFVKMDIEGAEVGALEGFGKYLTWPNVSFAIASYHCIDGVQTYQAVENLFRAKGLEASTAYPRHLTTYATKPDQA